MGMELERLSNISKKLWQILGKLRGSVIYRLSKGIRMCDI